MRHLKKKQRLVGGKDRRRLLLRNLVIELIDHQKIVTTLARAKAVKSYFDKIVTLAKKNSLHHKRLLIGRLGNNKQAAFKLLKELLPQISHRSSGFTSLRRLNQRRGDNSLLAEVKILKEEKKETDSKKKGTKKSVSTQKAVQKDSKKPAKKVRKTSGPIKKQSTKKVSKKRVKEKETK